MEVKRAPNKYATGSEIPSPKRPYGENAAHLDAERESAPAYGAPAKYRNEVRTLCGEKERARKGKVKAAQMSGFCEVRRAPRRWSVLLVREQSWQGA